MLRHLLRTVAVWAQYTEIASGSSATVVMGRARSLEPQAAVQRWSWAEHDHFSLRRQCNGGRGQIMITCTGAQRSHTSSSLSGVKSWVAAPLRTSGGRRLSLNEGSTPAASSKLCRAWSVEQHTTSSVQESKDLHESIEDSHIKCLYISMRSS